MKRWAMIIGSWSLLTLAACGQDETGASKSIEDYTKAEAEEQDGKAENGQDICRVRGWYNDGVCDDWCPMRDPDCDIECDAHERQFETCAENGKDAAACTAEGGKTFEDRTERCCGFRSSYSFCSEQPPLDLGSPPDEGTGEEMGPTDQGMDPDMDPEDMDSLDEGSFDDMEMPDLEDVDGMDEPDMMPDMMMSDQGMDMNLPPVDPCAVMNPPPRCSTTPGTFTGWGLASVVSSLQVADPGAATDCCFDYTGEGNLDNGLGNLLTLVPGGLAEANQTLTLGISDGTVAIVFEHDGLASLMGMGGSYSLYFWEGVPQTPYQFGPTSGEPMQVRSSGIAMGVQPLSTAPATSANNSMSAGPGRIFLTLTLLGVTVNVPVLGVRVESLYGSIDPMTGVELLAGELGGVVRIEDVLDAINAFTSSQCGCYAGGARDMFVYTSGNLNTVTCNVTTIDASSCSPFDPGESSCQLLAENVCPVGSILPLLADADSRNLGTDCGAVGECESFTLGAYFTATGARITGVAP